MKFTYRINKLILYIANSFLLTGVTACEDFLVIDPPRTEIVSETVFSNDASATSAMRGVYSLMIANQSFTNGQLERYTGLSSDELANHSANAEQRQFAEHTLVANNTVVLNTIWREAYRYIHNVNTILEGINNAPELSSSTRQQLEGEAKFVRAFCHFYLVNLFGDTPCVTSADYTVNASKPRTPVDQVYEQIISDLNQARLLLRNDFTASNGNRTQPNSGAATALLARVKLYRGNWSEAEQLSTELIENPNYTLTENPANTFLASSSEAIWQLQPVTPDKGTMLARLFVLLVRPTQSGSPGGVSLSTHQLNVFEAGDTRRTNWVGMFSSDGTTWYYANKYKAINPATITEHASLLRLAEQYLIRAEALAHQDKLPEALADIDKIRSRAGLSSLSSTQPDMTKEEVLAAIEKERRTELFLEGGHRWLDLNRTNQSDAVLAPIKLDWQSTDRVYPIPDAERVNNPALSQNPGY